MDDINGALASAIACLNVLRGASVLVGQSKQALVKLLTFQEGEAQAARSGARVKAHSNDVTMLKGLVIHFQEMITMSEVVDNGMGVGGGHRATAARAKRGREQEIARGTVVVRETTATSRTVVLTNTELLMHIMVYLGGGMGRHKARRQELGRMALVCRIWRDAAYSEALWDPLAKEVMYRLHDDEAGGEATAQQLEAVGGSYRRYMMGCGRLLMERGAVNGFCWVDDLALQFEVWDVDGCCMFSQEADIDVDEVGNEMELCAYGEGPSLPATTRPSLHLSGVPFEGLRELFLTRDELHLRITVHDKRTRRSAVLWGNEVALVSEVDEHAGTLTVTSMPTPVSTLGYGDGWLDTCVGLRVTRSTDGVDGVHGDQRLWRVTSAFIRFDTEGPGGGEVSVGRLILSLLQ